MVALKEVVASYEIKVDDVALGRLRAQLDRTAAAAKKTGRDLSKGLDVDTFGQWTSALAAATGAVGYASLKMASSVEENNNVVQKTFKDSADSVFAWSEDAAKAMGRSEYDLQRYAGNVGAFLSPVFKDTGVDIAAISEQVSELAVDLASFYNLNDQEAMLALQSGLSGETEAVRRFGINLADERLNVLNKEIRGQNAIYKNLGLREKTELRLLAIMKDTEDKQGDAAETAGSWANQLKAMEADYKKITVTVGQALLPIAKEYLGVFRGVSSELALQKGFFQTHVRSFESMAYFLGLSAVSWGVMEVAASGTAASTATTLAGLAAIWLVVDDLTHFYRDQKSLTGDILSNITGVKVEWKDIVGFATEWGEYISRQYRKAQAAKNFDFATIEAMQAEERAGPRGAQGSNTPDADRARLKQAMAPTQAVERGNIDQYMTAMEALHGKARSQAEHDERVLQYNRLRKQAVELNPASMTAQEAQVFGLDRLGLQTAQRAKAGQKQRAAQGLFPDMSPNRSTGPALAPPPPDYKFLPKELYFSNSLQSKEAPAAPRALGTPFMGSLAPPREIEAGGGYPSVNVTVHMTVNDTKQAAEELQQKLTYTLRPLMSTAAGQ